MRAKTIFQFLFGNADAIREIAKSQSALWTGAILVLLTAIARNYDQTFILEKPLLWLFGPLLFSIGSAMLIFCLVYLIFICRHITKPGPEFPEQLRSFFGLFWMTAPIAWLYAIPVERFFPTYQAAQANLALLAIVALWRVLLLARVFSVVQEAPFWRALLWVLIPASIEVFALYIFGGGFAQAIMKGMGGMRNSPEEDLLLKAMGLSANAAFWIGCAAISLLAIFQNRKPLQSFPRNQTDRMPSVSLGVLTLFWVCIAIYPQIQVNRSYQVEQLMRAEKYKDALQFLSAHDENDFAPSRQIPPKPYEYEVFETLPKIFEAMDGSETKWVRQKYFRYLEIMIHHRTYFGLDRPFESMAKDLERLPGGAEWLQKNKEPFFAFVQTHEPKPKTQATHLPSAVDSTNRPSK